MTLAAEASATAHARAAEYASLLREDHEWLRLRTQPEVWSPLEYACHMRDVLLAMRERVLAVRRLERPTAQPMGRDERVLHEGYAEQNPADVSRQLVDAAQLFSNVLDRLPESDWDRTLIFPFPEQVERSVRWLAVHTVHELEHHLLDMRRQRLS